MMIDGRAPGKIGKFTAAIKNMRMKPSGMELVVAAQGHIGHAGALKS